jgi:hypothetical protein
VATTASTPSRHCPNTATQPRKSKDSPYTAPNVTVCGPLAVLDADDPYTPSTMLHLRVHW